MQLIEFAEKYVNRLHSGIDNASINFLHPFQIKFLKSLQKNKFTHTTKSRQMLGMSTMLAIYSAWFLLFFKGEKSGILVVANPKKEMSINLLGKIQVLIDAYMKGSPKITQTKNRRSEKELSNGNKVIAVGSPNDVLCGISVDVFIIDEAAYISDLQEILTSFLPMIKSKDGQLHLISSPNGTNFFYKLKINNNNLFYKQEYHYSLNPYVKKQIEILRGGLSDKQWQQEMELEFLDTQSSPKDEILQFRINNEILSQLNERLLIVDLSLSEYIRSLIKKDLQIS